MINDFGKEAVDKNPAQWYIVSKTILQDPNTKKEEDRKSAQDIYEYAKTILPEDFERKLRDRYLSTPDKIQIERSSNEDLNQLLRENRDRLYQYKKNKITQQATYIARENAIKEELMKRGLSPQEAFTERGPFMKGLQVADRVFSSAQNATAWLTDRLADKIAEERVRKKIEHGELPAQALADRIEITRTAPTFKEAMYNSEGWRESIHRIYMENPDFRNVIEKKANNEALTPDQDKLWKEYENVERWLGGTLNVVADPGMLLDALVGKIAQVAKLSKANKLAKATDTIKNVADVVKKEAVNSVNAVSLGETFIKDAPLVVGKNNGKNIPKAVTEALQKAKNAPDVINAADDILKMKPIPQPVKLDNAKQIQLIARKKNIDVKDIQKSLKEALQNATLPSEKAAVRKGFKAEKEAIITAAKDDIKKLRTAVKTDTQAKMKLAQEAIQNAKNAPANTAFLPQDIAQKAELLIQRAKELSPKLAKQAEKSLSLINKESKNIVKAQASPTANTVARITDWLDAVKTRVSEGKGIRVLRKAFISDVPRATRPAFEEYRLAQNFYRQKYGTFASNLDTAISTYARKNKLSKETVGEMIANAVEMGGRFKDDFLNKIVDAVDALNKDILIDSVKEGVKAVPLGMTDEGLQAWESAVREYQRTFKANPSDPLLDNIEQKLYDMLTRANLRQTGVPVADMFAKGAPEYMLHLMTPEAKEFIMKRMKQISKEPQAVTSNVSNIMRKGFPKQSIDQINKMWQNGEITGELAQLLEGFTGKKIFETDPAKLLKVRGYRTANAVAMKHLKDSLIQLKNSDTRMLLFSDVPMRGLAPVMIDKEVIGYANPDVVTEITKLAADIVPGGKIHNKAVELYDKMLGGLRKITLLPFPSFHLRNELGNIYTLALANASATSTTMAASLMKQLIKPDAKRLSTWRFTAKDGRIYTGADVVREAEKANLFNAGLAGAEFGGSTAGFHPIQKTLNKLYENEKILSKGKSTTQLGRAVNKAQHAVAVPYDIAMDSSAAFGAMLENHAKLSLFIDRLRKGYTPAAAASDVRKFLFDYGQLTRFESEKIKRLAFFYTWFRKNLALQLSQIASPMTKRVIRAVNDWNESAASDQIIDERFMNQYLINQPLLRMGIDPAMQRESLMGLENLIPFYDLNKLVKMFYPSSDIKDARYNMLDTVYSFANPILKTPIDLIRNTDSFSGQKISEIPGDTTTYLGINMPTWLAYTLKQNRLASTLNKINPGNISGGQETLSWTGRINPAPQLSEQDKWNTIILGKAMQYDVPYSKSMGGSQTKKRILDRLNKIERSVYKFERVYAGKQYPMQDMQDLVDELKSVARIYVEAVNSGFIDVDDANTRNRIMKTMQKLGELHQRYKSLENQ